MQPKILEFLHSISWDRKEGVPLMCPLTGKIVACGLASAQVDLYGSTEWWFGVRDNTLVDLEVPRTTQRADIWSLCACLFVD